MTEILPATPDEVPTRTPFNEIDVNVSMPTPEFRMVNAGAFDEYHHSFGWASLYMAAAVGFGVPAIESIQTHTDATLVAVTLVFAGFAIRAGWRTRTLRKRIEAASVTHKMRIMGGDG